LKLGLVVLLLGLMAACTPGGGGTAGANTDINPDTLYTQDPNVDMIVYDKAAWTNAQTTDWVTKLTLAQGEELGVIQRTGVTEGFQDFDATKLGVGTSVYAVAGQPMLIVVYATSGLVPYQKIVEG
jgi:hypothetical protein